MKTNWFKKVSIYTIECIFWQRLFSQRKGESNKEASEDASTGRGQSPRERKFPPPSIDHPWGRLSAGWSCETAARHERFPGFWRAPTSDDFMLVKMVITIYYGNIFRST
uniref:Uncharacterized protein n=2 Tax=Araneus ventricosus TaxID=182803 RepID=A0A4Y1ZSX0_ARAVE|nr:hypothetical protein AVEN_202661-1 [Araneus ventricosus]